MTWSIRRAQTKATGRRAYAETQPFPHLPPKHGGQKPTDAGSASTYIYIEPAPETKKVLRLLPKAAQEARADLGQQAYTAQAARWIPCPKCGHVSHLRGQRLNADGSCFASKACSKRVAEGERIDAEDVA